jgi:hypothetical protein
MGKPSNPSVPAGTPTELLSGSLGTGDSIILGPLFIDVK